MKEFPTCRFWIIRTGILLSALLTFLPPCHAKTKKTNLYLNQKPPGIIPELFAPGTVCTGFNERDIAISPDGKEILFGLLTTRHVTIMQTRLQNKKWTQPSVAEFASDDRYYYLEPSYSPDGKTIYFLSNRPPQGKEPKPRWFYQNIWAADKKDDGTWGEIYNPDTLLNKPNGQFYPSFTRTGTLYFTQSDTRSGKPLIFKAARESQSFKVPEKLPASVNEQFSSIFNAFVAPDESFLIACCEGRNYSLNPDCANYYVFFRDKADNWSEGIPFGPEINMKGSNAISASVSPDGRFLFFAAQQISPEMQKKSKIKTLDKMLEYLNLPQNGNYDIYWVDAGVIDSLRNKK